MGVGRLNHGRDVGDVVRQEGLGRRAALAVLREVSGARKSRLLREDAEDCHESGAERTGGLDEQEGDADVAAEGVGVLPIALSDVAGALGGRGGGIEDGARAVRYPLWYTP